MRADTGEADDDAEPPAKMRKLQLKIRRLTSKICKRLLQRFVWGEMPATDVQACIAIIVEAQTQTL